MPSSVELLQAARITGIMQGLQDIRLLPQQLVWNDRIPDVPATDEEIMAQFQGQVQIADLIADDAKAAVYSMGRFGYEVIKIPNLKVGVGIDQSMLAVLDRLDAGAFARGDLGIFTNWRDRALQTALLGVNQRKESLKLAMLLDGVGFSYNRLGIKLDGPTWGMPSDLKVTVNTTWDTAGSATPIGDIFGVRKTGSVRYGVTFNRATMSTITFLNMIATTEFQNKARTLLAPNVSFANLNQADVQSMQLLATRVAGLNIELYDARYWTQNEDGAIVSLPFLPANVVLLTNSGNDGNAAVYNFGNGTVIEGMVSRFTPNIIGGPIPAGFGPIAYATPADANLNPPGLAVWGVARGFPRKSVKTASAVLTVGTYTDTTVSSVPIPV